MPEGPEIRRAADQVEQALKDKPLVQVKFGLDHLAPHANKLLGSRVNAIDTQGKAMLTRFDNNLILYTHNQLYGRWYVGDADLNPNTKRKLRVALRTKDSAALLYSASTIELLTDAQIRQHPFLSNLGPDVLHPTTNTVRVLQQLTSASFRKQRLGYLLTDQSCLAGLGNYLRCEALFDAQLHPAMRPIDCTTKQLERLAQSLLSLARQSYKTAGVTNKISHAKKLIKNGATFEQARFYLFRREGLPCYRCNRPIEKITHAGQACYLCTQCQVKAI
jgi:endonuclease-8